MACRRSLEIEMAEFLADPAADGFRGFREHYPRCPDCAPEVRTWTELHEALGQAHPEPARLAHYASLGAAERAGLDRHLARCPACREELSLLGSFDPAALAAPAPSPAARPGWREALGSLGRVVWHPGFAYALAALVIFPLLWRSPGAPLDALAPPAAFEAARERERPRGDAAPSAPESVGKSLRADMEEMEDADAFAEAAPAERPTAARQVRRLERVDVPAARLERDAIVELAIPPPGEALTLRVPLPVAAVPGAQATVRVRSGDGRRELVERFPVPPRLAPPGERVLLVPVPGGWLRPGVYRAVLEVPDAAPTHFSFVARGS